MLLSSGSLLGKHLQALGTISQDADADAGVAPAGRSGGEGLDADPALPVEVGDLAVLLDLGAEEGPGLQNPVLLGGARLSGPGPAQEAAWAFQYTLGCQKFPKSVVKATDQMSGLSDQRLLASKCWKAHEVPCAG